MVHLDFPSYIYRIRGDNTRQQNAREIQITMWDVHNKFFFPMMEKRCKENDKILIDLGGGLNCKPGYKSYDIRDNADIVGDLNKKRKLKDNSVGLMNCSHVFEHLRDKIHTFNELYRVMCHGGVIQVEIPSDV